MDHILLLTDFSDVALNASMYALHLTQTPGQQFTLLHAEMEDTDETFQSNHLKLDELQKKLEAFIEKSNGPEQSINYVSKRGSLTDSLKQVLKEQPIDFVVMGASDGEALPGFLFGNMVRDIIEVTNKPLLLIPEKVSFTKIQKLFYVTDLRYMNLNTINWLIRLTNQVQSTVSLLHVCASGLPNLSSAEASSLFADSVSAVIKHPVQLYNTAKDAEAEEVVNQMVENKQLSILAVAHHKYQFFKRIFREDPSSRSGVFKQIPLLILPV